MQKGRMAKKIVDQISNKACEDAADRSPQYGELTLQVNDVLPYSFSTPFFLL